MTITEFLLARIAEDEADAMAAPGDRRWEADPVNASFAQVISSDGGVTNGVLQTPDAVHVARWDPARVLSEVAAKRSVVELHTCRCPDPGCRDCGACSGDHHADPTPAPCDTIKTLAQVYAEHEDYDPSWSVTL